MSKLTYEESKALLLLNHLGSRKSIIELLEQGLPPSEVLNQCRQFENSENAGLFKKIQNSFAALLKSGRNFDPEREIETCEKSGVALLTWFDPEYPAYLKEITDPPLVLYLKGSIEETDQAAVAIVGTRHPSIYGLQQARRFARELAAHGITIVSGFARGVDQAAHEAALDCPIGRSLAVLGCDINVDYPKGSRKLFERLTEKGAVMTEYPLGTEPLAIHFPRRNRIISGLSQGVLVIEAHTRSGSLITAHEAAEQGRHVFAVPGPVDQITSRGAHKLIKEGAALAEFPEDIVEALAPALWPLLRESTAAPKKVKKEEARSLTPEESLLIQALSDGPRAYDQLAAQGLGMAVLPFLTRLELEGRIRKEKDGRFALQS